MLKYLQPKFSITGIRLYSRYEPVYNDWAVSETIHDRKSIFVGRAMRVISDEEARTKLAELKRDKKVAKSTHNITAWRIGNEEGAVVLEAHSNDGEPPAGEHMLAILRTMKLVNIMVVVTRWYGGIHLGSDRFRHIQRCTRDALSNGHFITEPINKKRKR